jgi:NitT/TauT family transport system substrate-binding protein
VSILTRWTPVDDARIYPQFGFAYIDPDGQMNIQSLADQLQFAREQGQITLPLEVQQTVDTRFAETAVQRLGHDEP